jgi:hypothetical protein
MREPLPGRIALGRAACAFLGFAGLFCIALHKRISKHKATHNMARVVQIITFQNRHAEPNRRRPPFACRVGENKTKTRHTFTLVVT